MMASLLMLCVSVLLPWRLFADGKFAVLLPWWFMLINHHSMFALCFCRGGLIPTAARIAMCFCVVAVAVYF